MIIFPKLASDTLVPLFQPKSRYSMIIFPKLLSDTLGVPSDLTCQYEDFLMYWCFDVAFFILGTLHHHSHSYDWLSSTTSNIFWSNEKIYTTTPKFYYWFITEPSAPPPQMSQHYCSTRPYSVAEGKKYFFLHQLCHANMRTENSRLDNKFHPSLCPNPKL